MNSMKPAHACLAISLSALLLLMVSVAQAQVPEIIAYQGYLTDNDGSAIDDEAATLTFRLWSESAESGNGAPPLWTEEHVNVLVSEGVFSVMLGSVEGLQDVAFDAPLWLGVTVGGAGSEELAPRVALGATPYSLRARSISDGAVTSSSIADGHVVRSLNGLADAVTIEAGENVSLTTVGSSISIAADVDAFALPFSATVEASDATAFEVRNTGTRAAANFVVDNNTNFNSAVLASSNGTGAVLFARTFGSGRAGLFRIDNKPTRIRRSSRCRPPAWPAP